MFAAARELGYRPNAIARAMISGRSYFIAVLVAYLDNQFYPIVIEQLSRSVADEGLSGAPLHDGTGKPGPDGPKNAAVPGRGHRDGFRDRCLRG